MSCRYPSRWDTASIRLIHHRLVCPRCWIRPRIGLKTACLGVCMRCTATIQFNAFLCSMTGSILFGPTHGGVVLRPPTNKMLTRRVPTKCQPRSSSSIFLPIVKDINPQAILSGSLCTKLTLFDACIENTAFPSVVDITRDATTAICITSSFSNHCTNNFSIFFPWLQDFARSPCTAQLQMNLLGHFQVADGYRGVRNR